MGSMREAIPPQLVPLGIMLAPPHSLAKVWTLVTPYRPDKACRRW